MRDAQLRRANHWIPLLLLTLILAACSFSLSSFLPPMAPAPTATPAPVQLLVPEVISVRPHDTEAWTQGLVWYQGALYESTGLTSQSSLRQVDLQTGAVLRRINVPDEYFAEGLALVDDRLIQLTWKEETAFVYDRDTFSRLGEFTYAGEGWGLCYDGESLYMSDGSAIITRRDPDTFAVLDQITVTYDGVPLDQLAFQGNLLSRLNELECVGGSLYANVWLTDAILQIDKTSGRATALIYAANLLTTEEHVEASGRGGVLNGIAYMPETDTFLITGKFWPKMFEVRFVPYNE